MMNTPQKEDTINETLVMIALTDHGQYICYEPTNPDGKDFWKEPMLVNVMPNQQGGPPQIQMIPLIQFGDKEVTKMPAMSRAKLIATYKANEQIRRSYEELILKLRAARAGIDLSGNMPQGQPPKGGPVVQLDPKGGFRRK